jgi:hypothetical protein
MNLRGTCCRCVGILVMLIGITTGSSAVQAGSEGTSSASRGPSGDAGANTWLSPSKAKAAPVKPTSAKSVVVSPANAAKLESMVKKLETELAKSGETAVSPEDQAIRDLVGVIRGMLGHDGAVGGGIAKSKSKSKSTSAKSVVVSPANAAELEGMVKKVETGLAKSGETAVSQQRATKNVQNVIGIIKKILITPSL